MTDRLDTKVYQSDTERIEDAMIMAGEVMAAVPDLRPAQVAYAVEQCIPGVGSDAARLATYSLFKRIAE